MKYEQMKGGDTIEVIYENETEFDKLMKFLKENKATYRNSNQSYRVGN
jgi:hypothetical protein